MAYNKVILMGRLTAAPELKQTQSGTMVTSFSIAVDRRFKREGAPQADFHTIVAWAKTAEFVCRYFGKGSMILVSGELQNRSWSDQQGQKRYTTEVIADEVSFCGEKNNSEGNNQSANQNATGANFEASPNLEELNTDDDLPF